MNKEQILEILDTVIKDLAHPSTIKAPDGVYANLCRRVQQVREGIETMRVEVPVPEEKVSRRGRG